MGQEVALIPTRRARAVAVAAAALYVAAFLSASTTLAVVATVLLVYLGHTRWAAGGAFDGVRCGLQRVLPEGPRAGQPFEVQLTGPLDAPAGVVVRVEDRVPVGAEPVGVGQPRHYRLVSHEAQGLHFLAIDVHLEDRRGLWRAVRSDPVRDHCRVMPSLKAHQDARRLARRESEMDVAKQMGDRLRELEFETLRPFASGDRQRDVDWKRLSQGRGLMTKQWARHDSAEVVLLLDAGASMRIQGGPHSKLAKAVEAATVLAEAAQQRGHAVGAVVFDEAGELARLPATHGAGAARAVERLLADLPGTTRAVRRLDVAALGEPGNPGDAPFLAQLATLGPDVGRGLGRCLRHVLAGGRGRTFVFLFSDLEGMDRTAMRDLGRLVQAAAGMTAVVLPGSHFYRSPQTVHVRDLEQAYAESEAQGRVRRWMQARQIHVMELGPTDAFPGWPVARRKGEARA